MNISFLFFGSETKRMDDNILNFLGLVKSSFTDPNNSFYFGTWNVYNHERRYFHDKVEEYFSKPNIIFENYNDILLFLNLDVNIVFIINGTNNQIPNVILEKLFKNNRKFRIIETNFNGNLIQEYIPDLILNFGIQTKKQKKYIETTRLPETRYYQVPISTIFNELNLDSNKFHIVIPEEICQRNNQKEILYYATIFQDKGIDDIVFHFTGETVQENRIYWQPITESIKYLNNCYFWNGRIPQNMFYFFADLILFTSHEKNNEFFLFETENLNIPILTNYYSNTNQEKLQKEQYKQNFEKIYSIYKEWKR